MHPVFGAADVTISYIKTIREIHMLDLIKSPGFIPGVMTGMVAATLIIIIIHHLVMGDRE